MTATPPATVPVPTDADDLGIDRAFLIQMAQVPFIALAFVLASFASHQIWAAFAPAGPNYGPLVVVCIGMVVAAVIDGWAFKVPNWLTLSLVVSGWVLGGLHSADVAVDSGVGGFGSSFALTMLGFGLLFPLLAIVGMGQGDVKMLMGFGAWVGAYFGMKEGASILVWAFAWGAVAGGVFGVVIMVCRRKFAKNVSNFGAIFTDLKVMAVQGPTAAAARASSRRPGWDRLPYGIPLCIGFLGYLGYLHMTGQL